jgi:hypothetical protein
MRKKEYEKDKEELENIKCCKVDKLYITAPIFSLAPHHPPDNTMDVNVLQVNTMDAPCRQVN